MDGCSTALIIRVYCTHARHHHWRSILALSRACKAYRQSADRAIDEDPITWAGMNVRVLLPRPASSRTFFRLWGGSVKRKRPASRVRNTGRFQRLAASRVRDCRTASR
jgi:hypothetical protein